MFRTMLAVVAVGLAPAFAAADDVFVKIVNADSGKVLTVVDGSDEAGAQIGVAKDGDAEVLQWKVTKDGDYLKLTNRKTGKVLDVNEASGDEGARLIQWDDKAEDNDNQRWSWVGDKDGKRLKSKSSGHFLDLDADGKAIQKATDDKAKGQLWKVVEVKK